MESAKEELQSYWEVASITHFCHLFKKKLKLPPFDFELLENALLEPITPEGDESGKLLIDKILQVLVAGYFGPSILIDETTFDHYFRELIEVEWIQNDKLKNPLIQISLDENGEERKEWVDFHALHVRTKVQILYKLCDYRLAAQDSSTFVKDAAGKLRHKPIGIDSLGYVYWYFHGRRLYKEKPKVAKILVEKLREPMKPVNGLSASPVKEIVANGAADIKCNSPIKENPDGGNPDLAKSAPISEDSNNYSKTMASGLKNQTTLWSWLKKVQSKPEPKSTTGVPVSILKESWSVICHNVEDWRKLIERMKHSLSLTDRELAERFKLTYLPKAIEAEEAFLKRQRAEERARLIALMPKRHSERIATKLARYDSLLQSNVIDSKLRNRENRDQLRKLYQEACSDLDEKDKSFDPSKELNKEKVVVKQYPVINHRYSTRRKMLDSDEPSSYNEENSQTSSGVGSSLSDEVTKMHSPEPDVTDEPDEQNESDEPKDFSSESDLCPDDDPTPAKRLKEDLIVN
ncbi:cat eye syndrome critical region protein 2 homolog [Tetranychus urticae]|uniref:DDT domain-containing protein n=1 Tax=Tetranychus urticae TaxID=32264 RepID=T1KMX2_TETUR|nr:cat eye syndrome critical region protein 2 homolog [Tetranychus urticae]